MTEVKKKDLSQYKKLAEVCVKRLNEAYAEMGKLLLNAEKDLGREYAELVIYLKHQGLSATQIAASRAVAQKKLDPALLFYAEKKLRLPNLPLKVQQTLRKVKHEIKQPDGSVVKEDWDSMPATHRFQLVGPKFNRIIPPDEQVVKSYGVISKVNVHFDGNALKVGRSTLEVAVLASKLQSLGQLDAFLTAIQKVAKRRKSA